MKNFCNFVICLKNALNAKKKYMVCKQTNRLILNFVKILYQQNLIKFFVSIDSNDKIIVFFNESSFEELSRLTLISTPTKPIYLKQNNIKIPFLGTMFLSTSSGLKVYNSLPQVKNRQGGLLLLYI